MLPYILPPLWPFILGFAVIAPIIGWGGVKLVEGIINVSNPES
jgi:hypothetical protein